MVQTNGLRLANSFLCEFRTPLSGEHAVTSDTVTVDRVKKGPKVGTTTPLYECFYRMPTSGTINILKPLVDYLRSWGN